MNLSHTGAKTWTKIHLKLPHPMIRTAHELFVRYRHWKLDDDKKKIVMSCENVSDYKTNSWQKQVSSIHPSNQVNEDVKIRINIWKDVKHMTMLLIGRQDGSGMKWNRKTCRILRLRRLHGRILHGKMRIPGGGILQNLTMSSEWDFFFEIFLSVHADTSQVSDCWNAVPTIRWRVYTEYTAIACMTYIQSVHKHARTVIACLWLKMVELYHLCAPERIRHPVSNVSSLNCRCHIFSLLTYHSTQLHLERATFTKKTLYTQINLLKSPYQKLQQTLSSRKATPKNHSLFPTLRVPETCETTLPHKRLGIELSIIEQRFSRNETRFQWVEALTMAADVLPRARDEDMLNFWGTCCTLLGIKSARPPRCCRRDDRLVNESYCDTKNADEQATDDIEKHLWTFGCVKMPLIFTLLPWHARRGWRFSTYFYFSCLLVIQRSSLDSVLAGSFFFLVEFSSDISVLCLCCKPFALNVQFCLPCKNRKV